MKNFVHSVLSDWNQWWSTLQQTLNAAGDQQIFGKQTLSAADWHNELKAKKEKRALTDVNDEATHLKGDPHQTSTSEVAGQRLQCQFIQLSSPQKLLFLLQEFFKRFLLFSNFPQVFQIHWVGPSVKISSWRHRCFSWKILGRNAAFLGRF